MVQGFVDPSWPNPNGSGDAGIIIYGYVPSITLCVLALAFFSVALLVHVFHLFTNRTWYFTPVCVACIMEIVGYVFRYQSAHVDPYRINFFVLAYFFIVVAPVFISASIYVCLNKLIDWAVREGLPARGWLRPKLILWSFVACDIVATIIQVTGAGLIGGATSNNDDPTTANNILLAGLVFQSAAFLVYLTLLGLFTHSVLISPQLKGPFVKKLRVFTFSLWAASILVFLRTLFRLGETAEGVFGYAMVHEVFFGTLDFAPIIVAVFLLAMFHPGHYFERNTDAADASSGIADKSQGV